MFVAIQEFKASLGWGLFQKRGFGIFELGFYRLYMVLACCITDSVKALKELN